MIISQNYILIHNTGFLRAGQMWWWMGYRSLDNKNCYQDLMFDDVYITVKHRISHTTHCPWYVTLYKSIFHTLLLLPWWKLEYQVKTLVVKTKSFVGKREYAQQRRSLWDYLQTLNLVYTCNSWASHIFLYYSPDHILNTLMWT